MTNCSEIIQKYESNGGRKMTDFEIPKATKRARRTPLPRSSPSPYHTRQQTTVANNFNSNIIIEPTDKTMKELIADFTKDIKKSHRF
jgi:hypothetical protein